MCIRDSYGGTGKLAIQPNLNTTLLGFQRLGDPKLAQLAYFLNGDSTEGLHADIFTKDPEAIASQIEAVIEEQGELEMCIRDRIRSQASCLRQSRKNCSKENRQALHFVHRHRVEGQLIWTLPLLNMCCLLYTSSAMQIKRACVIHFTARAAIVPRERTSNGSAVWVKLL